MKNKCATSCLLLVCVPHALFAQTPEIGIRRSGTAPATLAISAQEQLVSREQLDAARLEAVPLEVRPARERQLAVAREQDVEVIFRDTARVAQTAIRGTPADLRDITITSEEQMAALAEALYPLFGFAGTERLIFQGKTGNNYRFGEEINGLLVEPSRIDIVVWRDQQILEIRGTAAIDQNYGTNHFLDEQGAISAVNRHWGMEEVALPSSPDSEPDAYLVYRYWDDNRTLAPWWYVNSGSGSPSYVDPDGVVSSAVTVAP